MVIIESNGEKRQIEKMDDNGKIVYLRKPRMSRIFNDMLWIVNSDHSEILKMDIVTETLISKLGEERGVDIAKFSKPRWCCFDEKGNIYIADTDNHRIACRKLE